MTSGLSDDRFARLQATLKQAGLKLTHQRLEIFKEVAARSDHPDATDIHAALKDRLPTISLDTVYRTLWTLKDLGLLSTLGSSGENVRFDANSRPHHHFVCERCGLVRDFENDAMNTLDLQRDVASFGQVLATHLEVRGICASCLDDDSTSPTTT